MQDSLINQGLELMLFGMGTVVVFLTLLVCATAGMSALVRRYTPEPQPQPTPAGPAAADGLDPALVAAITAAIKIHRSRRSP